MQSSLISRTWDLECMFVSVCEYIQISQLAVRRTVDALRPRSFEREGLPQCPHARVPALMLVVSLEMLHGASSL